MKQKIFPMYLTTNIKCDIFIYTLHKIAGMPNVNVFLNEYKSKIDPLGVYKFIFTYTHMYVYIYVLYLYPLVFVFYSYYFFATPKKTDKKNARLYALHMYLVDGTVAVVGVMRVK